MWQRIFQVLAILMLVLLGFGLGPGSGGLALAFDGAPLFSSAAQQQTQKQQPQQAQQTANQQSSTSQQSSDVSNTPSTTQSTNSSSSSSTLTAQVDAAIAGAVPQGVNPVTSEFASGDSAPRHVPEVKGQTSLTLGDIGIESMPAGVVKLPDETLYILGVGPVTKENLDNPRWVFTQAEKDYLLAAATRQRVNDLPNTITGALNDFGAAVNDATSGNGNSGSWFNWDNNPLGRLVNDLTGGITGGEGHLGFYGLTPFTGENK